MDFKELAKQYEPHIIQQRRWFHRFPELTWEEYNTTDHIAAELEAMGLEVHRFEGITGCYAVLKGGKAAEDSKVLVLRSDIDALPVLEKTGLPFASENEGVMHACGHDTHMSMLLGAAKILTAMKEELQGTVRFLFQPAEEVAQGAIAVIKQGILDGADAVYGHHVSDMCDAGSMNIQIGPRMASSARLEVEIEGVSCHGSTPSAGVDAIVAAAAVIMNLQTIVSRNINPVHPATVTIGTIEGGQRFNIIANKVTMTGTVRAHYEEDSYLLEKRIKSVIESTAEALGARAKVDFIPQIGAVINRSEAFVNIGRQAVRDVLGEEHLQDREKLMISEDFVYYLDRVPGAFGFVGSLDETHRETNHNDRYDSDESILAKGAAVTAKLAADYLASDMKKLDPPYKYTEGEVFKNR